jgi:hypothetical protein
MTTPTATTAPATTPTPKPWGTLPCPLCGVAEAAISIRFDDMDTCSCAECSGDFSLEVVRDLIARWTPLLRWLSTSPGSEE